MALFKEPRLNWDVKFDPALFAFLVKKDHIRSSEVGQAVRRFNAEFGLIQGSHKSNSAVLIASFDSDDQARLLFTIRQDSLRDHAGQVSFPGGKKEVNESAIDAALREAKEEIGLDSSQVSICGYLPQVFTQASGNNVDPVVGCLDKTPTKLIANPHEVKEIFSVPIVSFLTPGVYEAKYVETDHIGPVYVHFFHIDSRIIWGATARMVISLLVVLDRFFEANSY